MNTLGGVPTPINVNSQSDVTSALTAYQATQNAALNGLSNQLLAAAGGSHFIIKTVDFAGNAGGQVDLATVTGAVWCRVRPYFPYMTPIVKDAGTPTMTLSLRVTTIIAATECHGFSGVWSAASAATISAADNVAGLVGHYFTQVGINNTINVVVAVGTITSGTGVFLIEWKPEGLIASNYLTIA